MPKIVDHDQRREELARAVWAVVARAGVEGATVRAVAAEAGWSMGALRYYFATQQGLLRFALDVMLQRVPERLRLRLSSGLHGIEQATLIIEELLPIDEERHAEALVWLAFLGRARFDPDIDDLRRSSWHGERFVCRIAVAELVGLPAPVEIGQRLPDEELEAEAESLHTFVDGLTLQGTTFREELPPDDLRRLLRHRLTAALSTLEETRPWRRP